MALAKETALKDIKLFVLDMDGTVYLGNRLIEGSIDFIHALRSQNRDFLFFTNNASRVPAFYVEKLAKMGLEVEEKTILTAGDVTAEYINKAYKKARVYLNGTPLLEENFRKKGINLVDENPEVVVQSFDTTLTYEKLDKICHFIRNGVPFLATHMDINCPTDGGYMPDCGAMCALITASTGIKPRYFGKPFAETVEMILRITGRKREEIAFVGDRLYTDVATGVNNGAKGFLVLTGEADMDTVASSTMVADCIFDSLKDMIKYL